MIRGTTAIYGIIGDPVHHSMSPPMQNRAFIAAGIDAVYVPFLVRPPQLPQAIAGLRALGVSGFNVTVPHKEAVLDWLDEVDSSAQRIGAVNTVLNQDGRLIGFNTDGLGLLRALREDLAFDPAGATVVLAGAGGACRAALAALAEAGARRLIIANRTLLRAQCLATDFSGHYPATVFEAIPLEPSALTVILPAVDLLINTVSAGLHGAAPEWLPWSGVPASTRIFDMLYSAASTELVRRAQQSGLVAVDGFGMLAGQGEESFRLWTGTLPAPGLMRGVLNDLRRQAESSST